MRTTNTISANFCSSIKSEGFVIIICYVLLYIELGAQELYVIQANRDETEP